MPTVLRFNGICVVIYPNDHRPAHVHVKEPVEKQCLFCIVPMFRQNFGRAMASSSLSSMPSRQKSATDWPPCA
ncbi:MAG: DUF4160 domain-containing protein [Rhodospirillales bacterium]|nr:DUF4160 domain-containing protein [Rhodospirillales bacterium]